MENRKIKTKYVDDKINLSLEAEKYPNTPLLDTSIEGTISLCITWKEQDNFIQELIKLIEKYSL